MIQQHRPPVILLIALLGLVLTACSPGARKARHLEQAGQAYAKGRYDEAEIHYKNVLRLDAMNPEAIGRLGTIYTEQGRIGQAAPFMIKARELRPDDLDLRVKYAQLCLATGSVREAQTEASYVIERRPDDPDAPLLLAATALRGADASAIRQRLQSLPGNAATGAPVLTALAILDLRTGNPGNAEALLRRAVESDPRFAAAHASLGSIYWFRNDLTGASQALRLAAENSPPRSTRRVQYAQFRMQTGDVAGGRKMLEEMTLATPDFLIPWTMLAEAALDEKDFKRCQSLLEKILSRDPLLLEALFIRGRMLLAMNEPGKAVAELDRIVKIYPRAPLVHHQLGLAQLAAGNTAAAANSLRQALTLLPGQPDASLALAGLHLRTGDPSSALVLLKPLIQQQPGNIQARLLVADAHRMQSNFEEALKIYQALDRDFPGSAQTSLFTGLVFLQTNQIKEARASFEQALVRSPGLIPALERLAMIDVSEHRPDDAFRRTEAEIARNPSSGGARILLARLCMMKKDTARASAELGKALELEPGNTEASFLLAQLYLEAGEDRQALVRLQSVLAGNPRDIAAWMLTAQIHEQRKDYSAAKEAYEKAIAIDPRLASAHNNLACLYSDHLNDPDKAYAAAQKARELLPQEPHVTDTLAWILYKKAQYSWALSLLEDSASKLPDSPVILHHLGMARYMLGREAPARLAFEQALRLDNSFPAAAECRELLALLAIDMDRPRSDDHALISKILAARPGDPGALVRLASIEEKAGKSARAVEILQKAAVDNPENPAPLLQLARLHAQAGNTAKALETAHAARKLAPDDPSATSTLGQIAYQAGDYNWASSLLLEAVQKQPGDTTLMEQAGFALYYSGQVTEAKSMLQDALKARMPRDTPAGAQSVPDATVSLWIELINLAQTPTPTAAARVSSVLSSEPGLLPAQMALAAIKENTGEAIAARQLYDKMLERHPGFAPAKVRIAMLAASANAFDARACELAEQARILSPNDPQLARALGILLLRKGGESARAAALLRQAVTALDGDAELFYQLGLAQQQSKDLAGARLNLQKAIDSGLRADLANEARRLLAAMK